MRPAVGSPAGRAALLVDMACYFKAANVGMSEARRSIHFLNWAFEQDTFMNSGPDCTGGRGRPDRQLPQEPA